MQQDGIDPSIFPAAAQYYTQYDGVRCSLPILADAYGFYYNKDLLAKAGLSAPPKTVTELTTIAKKLTDEEGRRLARRGRLRPVLRLLPEHADRLRDAVRRAVAATPRASRRSAPTPPGRRC